jgi:hypothetical protein
MRVHGLVTCFIAGPVLAFITASAIADDSVRFSRDILPILSDNCFACHGPDQNKRQAGLRLDVRDDALKAAESGELAIVPGKPEASQLIARITSNDAAVMMPPPDSNKKLTDSQKELFNRWIAEGANFERHWAFVPPSLPELPTPRDLVWTRTPIDRFLLARIEREGLSPRPEADRATLIRRVAIALTGLPPTLDEVSRFETDMSPTAYDAMVQRYLDSPRFGEEMARHWLDVARYADTHGLHLDNEREMWAYRDWVIKAFNDNLPFDQFTIEQLAGDLLPNPTPEQLVATGFNRCNVTTSEGGSIEPEFLYRYAVDRASTTAQAWLALTAGCAVCHDHKYDPLSTKEFYSLYAFFYSAADPAMDKNIRNTDPFLMLPNPDQKSKLESLRGEEQASKRRLEEFVATLTVTDPVEATPAPEKQTVEDVWFADRFPLGAKGTSSSRNPNRWTLASEMDVPVGNRALRQASAAMYQDKFEGSVIPLVVPQGATFSVSVHLDPIDRPQALMVELTTAKGTRNAIWGAEEKLGNGRGNAKKKPADKVRVGDLPEAGKWVRLEFPADDLNLTAGELVRGVALAQYGGVAHWSSLSVKGEIEPTKDPRSTFSAWWKEHPGEDGNGMPQELKEAYKAGPNTEKPEKPPAPEIREQLRKFFLAFVARPTTPEWQAARNAWQTAYAARLALEENLPGTFIFKDLEKPRDSFVMIRGQYDKPGEKVEPGVPAIFPPLKLGESSRRANRLDLAQWLMAPENPLTGRVAVNRMWQQFFGTGLVKTSSDFGAQGETPSHPELLDWMSVQYRESGWNTKEFVRLLVTSAAFRQDAKVLPNVLVKDPENRLYARGPRFRLDAEQIRDNALFVGGMLNLQFGGPGVKPYQPPNIWEPVGYNDSNTRFYLQDHGSDLYRRSIYCFLKRTAPPPFMSNFDGPSREQSCMRRERSNTPLQALQLMNDTQHFEAARGFAERILRDGGDTPEKRIEFAFRVTLARAPQADELSVLRETLDKYLERYRSDVKSAQSVIRVGESSTRAMAHTELAAYTLLGNLILNLDETLTRN